MLILAFTFLISIILPIIVKAASIQYTSDVTGDILSMSSQGNTIAVVSLSKKVSLTLFKKIDNSYQKIQIKNASLMGFNYPNTDIWRTELLKNHRPQFNNDGTVLYYVDTQFNFMYSDLTQVTPSNPYLNPRSMPNFNGCTGKTCILIVNSTFYAYFNPEMLQLNIRNFDNSVIGHYSWPQNGACLYYLSDRNVYSIMNIYIDLEKGALQFSYFAKNTTIWIHFIFGVSQSTCQYSTDSLKFNNSTGLGPGYYFSNNGDVYTHYQQFSIGYSWYAGYYKMAQKFTGWVQAKNNIYWAFSYFMNNVFQIQIIGNGTNSNNSFNFWKPQPYVPSINIIQDGYIKWFDINKNASIVAYISNYGQLVVVGNFSQNDSLDNRCYTSYLYLKNSQICMDIMALMWVLLGLSVLFPLFFIILFILYCRQRRQNMNQSNGNNMIGELASQYVEQPTRNNINQNKVNDQALRQINDNNELNKKNINQTDIHINI